MAFYGAPLSSPDDPLRAVRSALEMQAVFEASGMRAAGQGRPFALKGQRGTALFPQDTMSWLINFDWGDNSLRPPFGRE